MIQTAFITAPRGVNYLTATLCDYYQNWSVEPWIFAEPDSSVNRPSDRIFINKERLGCVANWWIALNMLVDCSNAEWYLIMEDDIMWQPDGANELRRKLWQLGEFDGIISPYCSERNVYSLMRDQWIQPKMSKLRGWCGALAIAIHKKFAKRMVNEGQAYFYSAAMDDDTREMIHLDAAIGATAIRLGGDIKTHNPTLVLHVGDVSTNLKMNEVDQTQLTARRPAL